MSRPGAPDRRYLLHGWTEHRWRAYGRAVGRQKGAGPFAGRSFPNLRHRFVAHLHLKMSAFTSTFSGVTIRSSLDYETGLSNVSFELSPGDLFLVRIERENERLPLADAMQGLAEVK